MSTLASRRLSFGPFGWMLTAVGTKIAGGCTSGNGLSGNAMASPASLVATMTFFVTAIVVTVVTEPLIA